MMRQGMSKEDDLAHILHSIIEYHSIWLSDTSVFSQFGTEPALPEAPEIMPWVRSTIAAQCH